MKKKGFTLVELLAVIALLALIIVIAVPSVMGVVDKLNGSMIDKKYELIEEAGVLYGTDFKMSVIYSNKKYDNFNCISVLVGELSPNYLDSDNDNACCKTDNVDNCGCVVDPSNDKNILDKMPVIIYYKNKRIYAKLDTEGNLKCE